MSAPNAGEFLELFPTAEFLRFEAMNPGFLVGPDVNPSSYWTGKDSNRQRTFTRPTEAHQLMHNFMMDHFSDHEVEHIFPILLHEDPSETYQMLAKTVNSIWTPQKADVSIEAGNKVEADTYICSMAERRFFSVFLRQESKFPEAWALEQGKIASTYVDSEGEPVLITKYEGDRSALSLKSINLNGIWLPPGTIFAHKSFSGSNNALEMYGGKSQDDIDTVEGIRLRVLGIDDIESLYPRRTSMWANLDLDERRLFTLMNRRGGNGTLARLSASENREIQGYSLTDFKRVVKGWLEQ